MSYRIELKQLAVFIPKEICTKPYPAYDDSYLLVSLGGDNNLINNDTGRFSRSWSLEAMGQHYRVMQKMIERSRACEGGELKGVSGDILPESYIKKWRTALKNPISIKDFLSCFSSGIKIAFNKNSITKSGDLENHINYLKENYESKEQNHFYYTEREEIVFSISVDNDTAWNDVMAYHHYIEYAHFQTPMYDNDQRILYQVENVLKNQDSAQGLPFTQVG